MDDPWVCRHWTLSNAVDTDVTDLPMLLRRVADHIEADGITAMELLDVTISRTIGAEGPTWAARVYWSPDAPEAD